MKTKKDEYSYSVSNAIRTLVMHREVCLEAIASGTQQGTVLFFGVLVGVRLQIKNGASWVSLRSNCPCWRPFRSR